MNEEKNSAKQKLKEGLKPTKNMAYIALVIVLIVIILISSVYKIFKDDFEDLAENGATYSADAIISVTEGIVSYVKDEEGNYVTDENGDYIPLTSADILEEINNISRYLDDDSESTKEEKLEYLLNAGLVTKFPYVEGLAEDKVNGIVKFYRYSEESQAEDENQEQYLLTFIDEETFNNKLDAGDADIFKYFTMDENQQLVIACKSKTTKTITTNDPEVTESIINEVASDTYTLNENGIFTAGDSTITKQSKDYQSIIAQYTIPFNLLAAFLVQTGDYDFVKEIADMAYESEINIGIYENVSITTNTEDYTYNKRIEYSPSTELDFSNVNTDPAITDGRYPGVVINCIAKIQENEENQNIIVEHEFERLDGIRGTVGGTEAELNTKYIKAMSNGKITELAEQASDAKTFETKYYSETESRTSVTIGTILADTWIARWEAKYAAEQNNPTPSGPNTGTEPNTARTIIECNSSSDLFGGTAKTNVDRVLSVHSDKLKQDAKDYILPRTNFEASARSMTASDIRRHAESCTSSPSCEELLNNMFRNTWKENNNVLTDSDLVRRVYSENFLSQVEEHVRAVLEGAGIIDSERARIAFVTQLANIRCEQYPVVAKSNVNISFTTTNTRYSTTYKQDSTDRTNDGEKFKTLFNLSEYHDARQAILERIQWFWEYIREYDENAKLENVLRYLLNIATDSNQFGTFTEEDIENLFKAFEPQELMKPATISGLQLLRQYICAWENQPLLKYINGEIGYTEEVAKCLEIDDDGKMYYKIYDVGGHPTVGFGIDLVTGAYYDEERQEEISFVTALGDYGFREEQLLYNYEETLIEVEIIDNLKEKRIKQDYDKIIQLNDTYNLNLTNYQIYALTSRRYNAGNTSGFVEAYTEYYNFETDDKYGEPYTNEDFEHKLYTEYMHKPINEGTDEERGLRARRKSEWILFLTGYMDRLDRFVPENSIIDCAEMIHSYMEENNYTYCVYYYNNNSEEECANRSLCGLNVTFEESKTGYHHSCCATYVSWVLQEAGYLTRAEHTDGAGTLKGILLNKGWQQIGSIDEAEPGDILYYDGHIEIYAGDYTVYNAGSGNAIRDPAPKNKNNVVNAKMILRAP